MSEAESVAFGERALAVRRGAVQTSVCGVVASRKEQPFGLRFFPCLDKTVKTFVAEPKASNAVVK